MSLEGYCEQNGAHYIGDADECWRCQLWEQQRTKEKMHYAVIDATLLAKHLSQ